MRIVILGATGRTGDRVLAQALELGHEVAVLVRSPRRLPGRLRRPLRGGSTSTRLRIVEGDARDRRALAETLAGREAVLSALGGRVRSEGRIRTEGTAALVDAMRATGVSRLLVESAFGAGDTRDRGPYCRWIRRVVPREYEDTEGMEEVVRRSGLDWVLARPTALTGGRLTRRYRVAEDLEVGWLPRVSRADVAHFMLSQLTGDHWVGRAPGITGP